MVYPEKCVDGVAASFMADLRVRLPSLCGHRLAFTGAPLHAILNTAASHPITTSEQQQPQQQQYQQKQGQLHKQSVQKHRRGTVCVLCWIDRLMSR